MIALDKMYHFGVGLCVTVIVGAALHPVAGVAACVFAGWIKEVYDKANPAKHTTDGWDAFATAAGAAPGLLLLGWLA